jgi:nitroimidazol reductase NimA-like FMN-containing flavoprotein (pyridoxamine 5'-phosphate oxidase superfamily)
METILRRATVCRIAMCDGDSPYVVAVNFGYADNRLYFHSATEGRKLDILARNNRVCFEADVDVELVPAEKPCGWTARYRSVVGFGRAFVVDDAEEKARALNLIVTQCGGKPGAYSAKALDEVAVVRVAVETMTGKQAGY